MRVLIDEVLHKQNKSRYWLSKEAGIHYQNLSKLANGETKRIDVAVIERICKALECEVGDILKMD